jgi:hypothetical protein
MMNDLDILRVLGGTEPVSDPDKAARARAALLAHTRTRTTPDVPALAARRYRWGRLGWRIAVPVAAAAVAVGALAVVENSGPVTHDGRVSPIAPGLPAAAPANAAEALGYAADAAAKRPFVTPRPDQWFYLEMRVTSGRGPGGFTTGGPYETETTRSWRRIDGTAMATYRGGKLVTTPTRSAITGWTYAEVADLRADPDAVLAWVRKRVGGVGGGTRDGEDQIAFGSINAILRDYVLPPAVEAACFQALAKLSGVALVPGAVNVDGRRALAVARVQEGWLRDEILLEPGTYRLIGERSVAIADHTHTADDGSSRIKKGTVQSSIARTAVAIVDHPGETST